MIEIETTVGPCVIVQSVDELPWGCMTAKEIFLDFETQSFDKKRGGDSPYTGDRIGGIAITWDDHPIGYYIPIRHTTPGLQWPNLPVEPVVDWLRRLADAKPDWVNHNVKFDAHFLVQEGIVWDGRLVCTLNAAKMIDSDRFGHGLKKLQKDWLLLQVDEVDKLDAWLKGNKTKNYCDAPADVCGEYAATDVLTNRMLWRLIQEKNPESTETLVETEVKLTSVLFDLERDGMQVDKTELKIEKLGSMRQMIELAENLENATGLEWTDSNKHLTELFRNRLLLPVLKWNVNKEGQVTGPSFDADTLAMYSIHPDVTAKRVNKEIVDWVQRYRKEKQHHGLFLDPFLNLADDNGTLHPDHNQLVRTGRMSCSHPNSQQLSKRARRLIHPREGEAFLSFDASQVEFRIIIHYIMDRAAIDAYLRDPKTDFHAWVAKICDIERDPAKNVNFAIGYGAGKNKVVSMLRNNPSVMKHVGDQINKMVEAGTIKEEERDKEYRRLCKELAQHIYDTYHERLPGIKRVSWAASKMCRRRGYVFNKYGRRRHLPAKAAYKAFNSVVQGCAMDIIKERMVALSPRFNRKIREWGIRLVANVHDEVLFAGPIAVMRDPEVQAYLLRMLETPSERFRVPILWDGGYSELNWYEAAKEEEQVHRVNPDGTAIGGRLEIDRTWTHDVEPLPQAA